MLEFNIHRYLKSDEKRSLSVLLVDDEENILNALTRELEEWASEHSLCLVTADNGSKAVEYVEKNSDTTAIVVSDMRMPGLSGSELVKKIHDLAPEASIILLTGYPGVDEMMEIMKAGITSYLLKPWESETLLKEMMIALRTYRAKEESILWKNVIEDELLFAGEMQRKLMSRRVDDTERFAYDVIYEPLPVFRSSGDYYDVFDLGRGRYLIVFGEIRAHKLKAAVFTGIMKATLYPEFIKAHLGDNAFPVSAFLSWIEKTVLEPYRTATQFVMPFSAVILDLETMRLTYANAGNPPFHLIRDSRCTRLHLDEPPLGMSEQRPRPAGSIELKTGDAFVFSTDGLLELFDPEETEKNTRFRQAVSSACESGHFRNAFLHTCRKLLLEEEMKDDVTVITVGIS